MAKVVITKSLFEEIEKKFKKDSIEVLDLIEALEGNPKKGKIVGTVGGIVIKEIKLRGFRFYFIADGFKLKFLSIEDLSDLLIKFIRMSNKKHQKKVIEEIKQILLTVGPNAFE